MRPFTYRTPRFVVSATFHFQMGESITPGVCTDVSQGGIRALVDERGPQVGSVGSLVVRYPQRQFTMEAMVSHLEGKEVGFSFLQRTEQEREVTGQFAAFLETQVHQPIL